LIAGGIDNGPAHAGPSASFIVLSRGASMLSLQRPSVIRATSVLALVFLLGVLGCSGGPKTYTVQGKVELKGYEVKYLAGCYVEAALASDNTVRSSGEIQPDGSFKLQTLRDGVILRGAVEGNYQARILLSDDDPKAKYIQSVVIDPKFRDFAKSGLTFQVPTTGEVTLAVSPPQARRR